MQPPDFLCRIDFLCKALEETVAQIGLHSCIDGRRSGRVNCERKHCRSTDVQLESRIDELPVRTAVGAFEDAVCRGAEIESGRSCRVDRKRIAGEVCLVAPRVAAIGALVHARDAARVDDGRIGRIDGERVDEQIQSDVAPMYTAIRAPEDATPPERITLCPGVDDARRGRIDGEAQNLRGQRQHVRGPVRATIHTGEDHAVCACVEGRRGRRGDDERVEAHGGQTRAVPAQPAIRARKYDQCIRAHAKY